MVLVSDEENNVSTTYNLRTTDELFDDQQNVVHPIFRVKRINKPKDNERWEVSSENNVITVIKRSSLTNGDAALLYTPEGIVFLLDQVKNGNTSASKIKEALQEHRRLTKKRDTNK